MVAFWLDLSLMFRAEEISKSMSIDFEPSGMWIEIIVDHLE